MVTIHVGTEKRKQGLHVHKDLICARSPFFKAALTNDWKEAQEGTVVLAEDDYDIVTVYVQWLYRNKLFHKEDKEVTAPYASEMDRLTSLYVFAEKIGDVDFMDTVVDAIIARVNSPYQGAKGTCSAGTYPAGFRVTFLYANSPETSPIRRLMVDYYVWYGKHDWPEMKDTSLVPKEFLRDLAVALMKARPTPAGVPSVQRSDTCIYHQHTIKGTLCYKKTADP